MFMQEKFVDEILDDVQEEEKPTNVKKGVIEEEDASQDAERLNVDPPLSSTFSKRLRKLLLLLAAIWLTVVFLRAWSKPRQKVIYASRYSEEYKFRPAASPVITEHLKDGRVRVRGAEPSARSEPPQKPKARSTLKKQKRKANKRRGTKGGK